MRFSDDELKTPGKIYIEKFNTNQMNGIVANLLHCDYNVIITLDDDTGDYIVQYCSSDSEKVPAWVSLTKTIVPRYANEP